MEVAWIVTDPGSGDLASTETRSDIDGFRSNVVCPDGTTSAGEDRESCDGHLSPGR
jgi:hypothetical protein